MTQGGPFGSTNVLAYYMYETAISEYGERYGYGSAIATVLFIIMLFYISYFLWRMYQDEKGGHLIMFPRPIKAAQCFAARLGYQVIVPIALSDLAVATDRDLS